MLHTQFVNPSSNYPPLTPSSLSGSESQASHKGNYVKERSKWCTFSCSVCTNLFIFLNIIRTLGINIDLNLYTVIIRERKEQYDFQERVIYL